MKKNISFLFFIFSLFSSGFGLAQGSPEEVQQMVPTELPKKGEGVVLSFNTEPDAVIATQSLSSLPKDIVTIPMLRELLTEDFVFYYNDGGEDWLNFKGALFRIAYERQTDWPTRLLAWLLNGPAEVALWKGKAGRLSHFMVVVDHTAVKALFGEIAKQLANGSDTQISLKTLNGKSVYVLRLPTGREVFISSQENRLYVYSDVQMVFPDAKESRGFLEKLKSFFGANQEIGVFAKKLGTIKHSLTVSLRYLSFGYHRFFNEQRALRFDFEKEKWRTALLAANDPQAVDSQEWAQVPRGAAFCFAVPFDRQKVGELVQLVPWTQKSNGNAVVCWYPESSLETPLLALRGDFSELMAKSGDLKRAFDQLVGAKEIFLGLGPKPRLAVKEQKIGKGRVALTREVGARYGLYSAKQSKDRTALGSLRFLRIKLAATSGSLFFSPDDRLVDKALSTQEGKFPSMASSLPPAGKSASVVFAPQGFVKMAKAFLFENLPESEERIFRSAVSRQLLPNLERFSKKPMQVAVVGGSGVGDKQWKSVDWISSDR